MFLDFLQDGDNYEDRNVARTDLENGFKVSTDYTSGKGYETAIIDITGTYRVERYKNKKNAVIGHKEWVGFARHGIGRQWSDCGDGVAKVETIK